MQTPLLRRRSLWALATWSVLFSAACSQSAREGRPSRSAASSSSIAHDDVRTSATVRSASATPPPAQALPPRSELPDAYLACGCGCCTGEDGKDTYTKQCLSYAKGDDIRAFITRDKRPANCSQAGCSMGTKYVYCDDTE